MASLTDKIRERAAAAVARKIMLSIPDRGIDLVCVTLTDDQVSRARKGARRRFPSDADDVMRNSAFLAALLAEATQQVLVDGEVWESEDGDVLTFKSREVWPSLAQPGTSVPTSASEAVRAVVGRAGDVVALGEALMRESGFAADGSALVSEGDENPT